MEGKQYIINSRSDTQISPRNFNIKLSPSQTKQISTRITPLTPVTHTPQLNYTPKNTKNKKEKKRSKHITYIERKFRCALYLLELQSDKFLCYWNVIRGNALSGQSLGSYAIEILNNISINLLTSSFVL